jgi:serine/threonine-protein kinase
MRWKQTLKQRLWRTVSGVIKGEVRHFAPEQVRGQLIDHRADVWALGTILWGCLAGYGLFERASDFEEAKAIIGTEPIPDICAIRPDTPRSLGDTLARAITRDRDARFATAREMGEALSSAAG